MCFNQLHCGSNFSYGKYFSFIWGYTENHLHVVGTGTRVRAETYPHYLISDVGPLRDYIDEARWEMAHALGTGLSKITISNPTDKTHQQLRTLSNPVTTRSRKLTSAGPRNLIGNNARISLAGRNVYIGQ